MATKGTGFLEYERAGVYFGVVPSASLGFGPPSRPSPRLWHCLVTPFSLALGPGFWPPPWSLWVSRRSSGS
eukprot:3441392-Karenia_brevis.AAC.1